MGVSFPLESYDKIAADNAQEILTAAADIARDAGVPCETIHVKDRLPAEGILDAAEARHCGLIVMSSHGRTGFKRLLLGSEADEVVSKSTNSCLDLPLE